MHLHGEEHLPANVKGSSTCDTKMANGGVDVRLRRQPPVSVKPPRLRLSATNSSSTAASKMSTSRHSAGAQLMGKSLNSNGSASNNKNNNTSAVGTGKSVDGSVDRIVPRSSRSSSVSKISGSSSCGRRIKGRSSRAGITASTFTPAGLSAESGNSQSLSKSLATGLSRSCENVGTAVFSTATFESGTGSGRPLIHHQRHNLKTRFQLLNTLGEGTYGKVKLAVEKSSGEQVAIKYIKKTKIVDGADLARIRREIQILSSLRHSHVVNIREVFEKKDKIVLVMDYAQGGELYDYLNKMGRLGEWEARRIFRQIVSAIHCCHQNGIVHRDLKLENIILDDAGNVKIADFGLANYYSHSSMLTTFCGSPLYASPEIVNGRSYYGPEVDVWSLGVILYTLVYGSMPFESNSLVSLKQQISDGHYRQPSKPSDAAGLIRHMLTVTPARRASMEDALRHWWVNFGHPIMPNGQLYNPCEVEYTSAPPQDSAMVSPNTPGNVPETLTSPPPPSTSDVQPGMSTHTALDNSLYHRATRHRHRRHSLDGSRGEEFVVPPLPPPPPPAIIHQRNQSSLSSDSDAELELLKSSRWDQCQPQSHDTGSKGSVEITQQQQQQQQQQHQQQQQQHRRRGWRLTHQKTTGSGPLDSTTGSGPLDSTGNSVNSSGSASPASNTEDSYGVLQGDDTQQQHYSYNTCQSETTSCSRVGPGEGRPPPSILKLPPALMDILGSCSEKSLTALLTPDPDINLVSFNPFGLLENQNVKGQTLNNNLDLSNQLTTTLASSLTGPVNPSLDLSSGHKTCDVTNNNVYSISGDAPPLSPQASLTASLPCPTTTTTTTNMSSTADPFVFDSERKPKRSILKRRGKFSGADPTKKSENNAQNNPEEENHIPKSGGGHLPRRLPSFRDEAHGIFAWKHRASQLLEEVAGTLAAESCSNALRHSHHSPWGQHTGDENTVSCFAGPPSATEHHPCPPPLPQRKTHSDFVSPNPPDFIPCPQQTSLVTSKFSPQGIPPPQSGHLISPAPVSLDSDMETNMENFQHQSSMSSHSQPYNVDLANGNFPSRVSNDKLIALMKNGDPLLAGCSDAQTVTAITTVEERKGVVDTLLSPCSSDCVRTRTTTSAKSPRDNPSTTDRKNITTPAGDCSANFSSHPQSAKDSNRSSASNSSGDSAYESSSLCSHSALPSTLTLTSTPSPTSSSCKVVRRSGNILKSSQSQLEQARNRLSVSSIGSNSSADILDLSYDSGDSDHFVNLETDSVEQAPSQSSVELDKPMLLDSRIPAGLDTDTILPQLTPGHSTRTETESGLSTTTTARPELTQPWTRVCQKPEEVDLMIFPDDEDDAPEIHNNRLCEATLDTSSPTAQNLWGNSGCDADNITGKGSREHQSSENKMVSLGVDQPSAETREQQHHQTDMDNITESGSPLLYRLAREAQTWL